MLRTYGSNLQTVTSTHQMWNARLYNSWVTHTGVLMSLSYAQKQKVRVTLELDVFEDFDAHQVDWERVLDIQGNESVTAYIETLSLPDRWWY